MITFADAQNAQELRIAGVCPTSDDFRSYLNRGTRLLMKRGNWQGTIQFSTACVYGNIVTWNRYIGTVLAVEDNCHSTIPMNLWHDWVPPGDAEARDRYMHWHKRGCGSVFTTAIGNSPVFNQITPNEPKFIQVYPTVQDDLGKTITLFGTNDQGQQVITRRPNGSYQLGEVITLGLGTQGFVMSQSMYKHVDRVVKDPTQGRVNLFQFDPVLSLLTPLAVYEPSETNPIYQQSRVPNVRACSGMSKLVSAMVKVQFVEVQNPTDLVQIDNLDALALAMQSAKATDAYDHAGAEAALSRAVRDLNYELRDKFPLEQTTVSFRPFGTATLDRIYIGMR